MFTAHLLPGQGFFTFYVHRKIGGLSSSGKPKAASLQKTEIQFLGALVGASQKEIEHWKQEGHPITHKIIEYSAMQKAKATDYLIMSDGREFYVQGVKNPGNLNVTMIYYVEERFDVRKTEKENV